MFLQAVVSGNVPRKPRTTNAHGGRACWTEPHWALLTSTVRQRGGTPKLDRITLDTSSSLGSSTEIPPFTHSYDPGDEVLSRGQPKYFISEPALAVSPKSMSLVQEMIVGGLGNYEERRLCLEPNWWRIQ